MSWLLGQTGQSFFDVWTVVHVAFWLVIGANAQAIRRAKKLPYDRTVLISGCVITLVLAFVWETAEALVFERIGWVANPERWLNRYVSDPLVGVLGFALGMVLIRRE